MADRFWVGGAGTWNNVNTANWSDTSGGSGGFSAPTSSDDVFINASSGSGTCNRSNGAVCRNFNTSNSSVTISNGGGTFNVFGNLVHSAGQALSLGTMTLSATTTGKTITTNGATHASTIVFDGVGGEWTLADNLTMSGGTVASLTVTNGSFVTGGFNISCTSFNSSNSNVRSISLGASTITCNRASGNTPINFTTTTNLTFNAGTSTIVFNGQTAATSTFNFGSLTWYNFTLGGASSIGLNTVITGSNTFNTFTCSAARNLKFTAGTTNTAANWALSGSFTEILTITSVTSATHTLAKSGGGTVEASYCTISYSIASPAATFTALDSTNSGNNTNWSFSTTGKPLFVGSMF